MAHVPRNHKLVCYRVQKVPVLLFVIVLHFLLCICVFVKLGYDILVKVHLYFRQDHISRASPIDADVHQGVGE